MAKKRYRSRGDSERNTGRPSSNGRPRRRRTYRSDFSDRRRSYGPSSSNETDGATEQDEVREDQTEIELTEGIGLLEMHPSGYGFLRSPSNNYSRERTDPFVPTTMIEKFRLRLE